MILILSPPSWTPRAHSYDRAWDKGTPLHSLMTSSQDPEVEASDTRGTSLVVQWLRIHFPLQGTRVQPLWAIKPSLCKETQHSQTSKQNNNKEQWQRKLSLSRLTHRHKFSSSLSPKLAIVPTFFKPVIQPMWRICKLSIFFSKHLWLLKVVTLFLFFVTEDSDWQTFFSSVQFCHSVVSDSLRPHELQHTRPPCPSPTPRVYSNSCPSSRWCHPAISSSVIPFSSCPQPLPTSGSFPMSQLFAWGGQSTGVTVSASVLPMNTQDLSP